MTTPPVSSDRPLRAQIARLFADALEGSEQAEIDLHLLAFETDGRSAGTDEAQRASIALGGRRPDGACPVGLRGVGRRPWVASYVDQLRAELDHGDQRIP